MICSVTDCANASSKRGMCNRHYLRNAIARKVGVTPSAIRHYRQEDV